MGELEKSHPTFSSKLEPFSSFPTVGKHCRLIVIFSKTGTDHFKASAGANLSFGFSN